MSSTGEEKTLTLRSKDDKLFSVKESIAVQCLIVKNMVDDGCATNIIPVYNVDAKTLALVLEYLNRHADTALSGEDEDKFDAEFVNREMNELLNLLTAADYLECKRLTNLLLDTISSLMKEMTVEKIREAFNLENDYTKDEEAEIRKMYPRSFQ